MNHKHFYLLLVVISQFVSAQKNNFKIPDSLKNKNFNYLDDRIYALRGDSLRASVYLYAYLSKAKSEKNWKEIINGYQNILHESPESLKLIYADSMIYVAKQSKVDALIGSSYLSKGIVYYGKKELQNALDNYIIANNFISKTNDKYLIYKVKYNIAVIKSYLGFYDEAISLFKECIVYFKDNGTRPYLNSLHSLGLCYNKIGDLGQCSQTNALGLSESIRLKNKEMTPYFIQSEGINQYFRNNYSTAIRNLQSSLDSIIQNKDFASESIANFYIAKSLWQQKKYEKALPYFQKVDQIFRDKGYIRPDLRETYELLIQFYKTKDNLQGQLYSIDQLLKADDLLNESYKYLVSKIHKEYNTKELLFEKEKIHSEFLKEKQHVYFFICVIIVLFIISFFLSYKHLKNRRIYKQKFDELMLRINSDNKSKPKVKSEKNQIMDINHETVANILKQLEKFEHAQKFLEKDLTLSKLAVRFKSNPKYLSIVIAHYRDKSFSKYINDLKIDYLVNLLKTDKRFRNYSNLALAEEAGFTSTQRFAHAFLSKTEITATYFIEQIKKEKI
ncbi:helix-turn-helix domain-containing protein [Flavobacterium sp. 2]|uniref:helix-turn-helix domain-containing protein n=1 Tax=Flavobacterium sp. 2 TaxID=308053 RepID=UPI003CF93433